MKITDLDQPLIVSKLKKKDLNRGEKEPILLVPELCTMTGSYPKLSILTCASPLLFTQFSESGPLFF